jgi:hypothetical protein
MEYVLVSTNNRTATPRDLHLTVWEYWDAIRTALNAQEHTVKIDSRRYHAKAIPMSTHTLSSKSKEQN